VFERVFSSCIKVSLVASTLNAAANYVLAETIIFQIYYIFMTRRAEGVEKL